MTVSLLYKIAPITLDATGGGVATIGPIAVNEYWWPSMVRVGTLSKASPVPYCFVTHGGVGAVGPTAFIDDTNLGSGDTSSIIAGITVRYGEVITATFSGGNPGDNAVLIVSGVYSDLLGDIGPQVPGTHFAGKPSLTLTNTIGQSIGPNTVSAGATAVGPIIDVRQWASYYLEITAIASGVGNATAYNRVECDLTWFNDSIGSTPVYVDSYEFFANAISGFVVNFGQVAIQDKTHGPYMRVNFTNNAASDGINISWNLFGTTRDVGQPYVRQSPNVAGVTNTTSGLLVNLNTVPLVAGLGDVPFPLAYGPVELVIWNDGGNVQQFTLSFNAGAPTGSGTTGYLGQVAVGTSLGVNPRFVVTFPKRAGLLHVLGTGSDQYSVRAIANFNRV